MQTNSQPKAFEDSDFTVYTGNYVSQEEWNGKRLDIRRKLEGCGKIAQEVLKSVGSDYEVRTSLHHPFEFNGFRVLQQWVYLTRNKKQKTALKKVLGSELGKDLDSSYRNAYLALTIDAEGLEFALKIHPDAWYDGQNFKNKCNDDAQLRHWLALIQKASGFEFRIHDWKKIYNATSCTRTDLLDFFKYYIPGEHRFTFFHRIGKSDPLAKSEEFIDTAIECFKTLSPLYGFLAWSPGNDHLKLRG